MSPTFRRSGQILDARIGDDFVALSRDRGLCFGMTDVAADIWDALAQPRSVDEICERLCAIYDIDAAQCRLDVTDYLNDLLAEGMIEQRSG